MLLDGKWTVRVLSKPERGYIVTLEVSTPGITCRTRFDRGKRRFIDPTPELSEEAIASLADWLAEHRSSFKLVPGKFYLTEEGARWCCFRVDEAAPEHCRAHCVQVATGRVEQFYMDGRYDAEGKREHTLVGIVRTPRL